jgi:hypothetical protein
LRQTVGDRQLMQEQQRRLVGLASELSWITIQVLSFSAGPVGITGGGSFSILRFPALPALGLVHLSGPNRGVSLEQPHEVSAYLRAFAQMQAAALSSNESQRFIRELAEGWV